MPQKPDIIGTFSSTGKVFIFDRTRHPSDPPEDGKCRPEIELQGHLKEGFGLSWSPMSEGNLLTASADKTICHWNISTWTKGQNIMNPVNVFTGHDAYVEDVAWHPHHDSIFGSVGDDFRMMIWDMRKGSSQPVNSILAHSANANCIGFSPSSDTVLATAGSDNVVNLWDLRNLNSKVHSLIGHEDEIRSLSWSPTEPTILASAGLDRRLLIWDVSRIGEHQSPEDAEDGPPELMFLHGGHTDLISDLSWNLNRPWTMASVAEDNVCQIWQVAQNIYNIEEVPQSSEVKE
ncbi:Histone acetyltransferase type B subunit 2 [Entomophthora muscae]|uniref:Histone acetyltransferase type B subunit 2 n=1 Tax=Entomophthora muscae TaxID=34485 RepID=A0ACC2TQI0_9FUNG|nr:Histone acetyltransferase type B subunit 2 [Entomophthora muscae]